MAKKTKDIDETFPDELGHFTHHFSITMEMDKHPLIMAMAAIALILVGIHILKQGVAIKAQNASGSTGTYSGNVPVGVTTPVTITNPTGTPVPVTVTNPVTTTTGPQRMIRSKGLDPSYDNNASGVPLRATPGGTQIASIPFGASVTINGSSQDGPNNFGSNTPSGIGGSTTWFPVIYNTLTGYVSAYDLV